MLAMPLGIAALCALHRTASHVSLGAHFNLSVDRGRPMMKPVMALVGRPNVGKSTLFNRITKSRDAIVSDYAGLTRDRHYGNAKQGRLEFIVIDTGGFEPKADSGI